MLEQHQRLNRNNKNHQQQEKSFLLFAWKNGIKICCIYFHPSHQNNLFTVRNLWVKKNIQELWKWWNFPSTEYIVTWAAIFISDRYIIFIFFYFLSMTLKAIIQLYYFGANLKKVEQNFMYFYIFFYYDKHFVFLMRHYWLNHVLLKYQNKFSLSNFYGFIIYKENGLIVSWLHFIGMKPWNCIKSQWSLKYAENKNCSTALKYIP